MPFGEFKDFDACVAANRDKRDPEAFCAALERTFERTAKIAKVDEEKRLVYGVVLEPGTEDAQGHVIEEAEVEKAAHRFAEKYARGRATQGEQHEEMLSTDDTTIVETFLAPIELRELGGEALQEPIAKGSWVIVSKVHSDELWADVKSGTYTGYSIGGHGYLSPA